MKKVLYNYYLKMNIHQIQLNGQDMASLLLASLIVAVGLAWTGADTSSLTIQSTNVGQPWSQLRVVEASKPGGVGDGVSFVGCDSELSSWSYLRVVKGTKIGTTGGGDGVSFAGCGSGLSPEFHLRSVKGRKGGSNAGEF